jgi:hypothetical protein
VGSDDEDDGIPKHKKEFDKFHSENGVRTVMGSIGPVQNGLLCVQFMAIRIIHNIHHSPNASKVGLPPCLHFAQICHEAWFYPL